MRKASLLELDDIDKVVEPKRVSLIALIKLGEPYHYQEQNSLGYGTSRKNVVLHYLEYSGCDVRCFSGACGPAIAFQEVQAIEIAGSRDKEIRFATLAR